MDPGNPEVIGGLVRALVADGQADEARILLDAIDQAATKHPAIARARAALDLVSAPAVDVGAEEARLAADPDDHEARFAIANAKVAGGRPRRCRGGIADHHRARRGVERRRGQGAPAADARGGGLSRIRGAAASGGVCRRYCSHEQSRPAFPCSR